MMILREMVFKNYKVFRAAKLQLPKPTEKKFISVIIGSMGTGKTSLTHAYQWCLYGDAAELGAGIASNFDETRSPIATVVKAEFDAGPKGLISLERIAKFVSDEGEMKQVCSDGVCSSTTMSTNHKGKTHQFTDHEKFIEWYFPKSVLPLHLIDYERLTDDRFLTERLSSSDAILELISRVSEKLECLEEIFDVVNEYLSLSKYAELARNSVALSKHLEGPLIKQKGVKGAKIELREEERYILETIPKEIDSISPSQLSKGEYSAVVMLKILGSLSTIDLTNPIMMDNPFAGFSPDYTKRLGEILKNKLKGKQVIILITDSEYDKTIDALLDSIQVEYEINYNNEQGSSFRLRNCYETDSTFRVKR